MQSTISPEELNTLTDVLKEYMTDLRGELMETDDIQYKQVLRNKEEVLRTLLAKFEREKQAIRHFLKV